MNCTVTTAVVQNLFNNMKLFDNARGYRLKSTDRQALDQQWESIRRTRNVFSTSATAGPILPAASDVALDTTSQQQNLKEPNVAETSAAPKPAKYHAVDVEGIESVPSTRRRGTRQQRAKFYTTEETTLARRKSALVLQNSIDGFPVAKARCRSLRWLPRLLPAAQWLRQQFMVCMRILPLHPFLLVLPRHRILMPTLSF